MRADGRDHDGRHGRVDHGGAGRDGVGGAARRGRDDEAVALDGSDELAVQVQVDVGEVGGGSAVDDHLVEDQEVRRALAVAAGAGGRRGGGVLLHDHAPQAAAERESGVACKKSKNLALLTKWSGV